MEQGRPCQVSCRKLGRSTPVACENLVGHRESGDRAGTQWTRGDLEVHEMKVPVKKAVSNSGKMPSHHRARPDLWGSMYTGR